MPREGETDFAPLWEAIAQAAATKVVLAVLAAAGGVGLIILETTPP